MRGLPSSLDALFIRSALVGVLSSSFRGGCVLFLKLRFPLLQSRQMRLERASLKLQFVLFFSGMKGRLIAPLRILKRSLTGVGR